MEDEIRGEVHFRERINRLIFRAKPNYRILMHDGVTPSGLLKMTSTIAFQQVTPIHKIRLYLKMKPNGSCIWIIGDSPKSDIVGARDAISAVTLQKAHEGVEVGEGDTQPDAIVRDFESLCRLFQDINDGRR